jgi:hypothetical protein
MLKRMLMWIAYKRIAIENLVSCVYIVRVDLYNHDVLY